MSAMIRRYGKILGVLIVILAVVVSVGILVNLSRAQTATTEDAQVIETIVTDPNDADIVEQQDSFELTAGVFDAINDFSSAPIELKDVIGIPTVGPAKPVITRTLKTEYKNEIIAKRESNYRYWQIIKEYEVIDPVTTDITIEEEISQITEVGCGICYQGQQGSWQLTEAKWIETVDGFVMDTAGYQLVIGKTLNDYLSYTIDGDTLNLRPVSIKANDANGEAVLNYINGSVIGQIDPDDNANLVFANAFGLGIDLVLTVRPDGYAQDIVFHQAPQLPMGIDPTAAAISVVTEVVMPEDMGAFVDSDEEFVENATGEYDTELSQNAIEFVKVIEDDQGKIAYDRHRLVESKVFDSSSDNDPGSIAETAGLAVVEGTEQSIAVAETSKQKVKAVAHKKLARDQYGTTHLVETLSNDFFETATYPVKWDYNAVSATISADETWDAYPDNIYYIGSNTTITGCTVTIEPGVIVKFANNTSLTCSTDGILDARGIAYRPIIFTSVNDDANGGELSPYSTGTPAAGNYGGIVIGAGSKFEFCRVLYATTGLELTADFDGDVKHNCFKDCPYAIEDNSYNTTGVNIFNNLIANSSNVGILLGSDDTIVSNNTIDNCGSGITTAVPVEILNTLMTNCMIGLYNSSSTAIIDTSGCAFYNNTPDITTNGGTVNQTGNISLTKNPYATSTYGSYYLNTVLSGGGGMLVDAGFAATGGLSYGDSDAWAIYPPVVYSSNITATSDTYASPILTLCDTGTIDIGYHHPRVDYVIDDCTFTMDAGTNLQLNPGLVMAVTASSSSDSRLFIKGSMDCNGKPGYGGYILLTSAESASQFMPVSGASAHDLISTDTTTIDMNFSFTRFWDTGDALDLSFGSTSTTSIENCQFWGNLVAVRHADTDITLNINNSLFVETETRLCGIATVNNCTFDNITQAIYHSCLTFTLTNSVFNDCSLCLKDASASSTVFRNNAYYNYGTISTPSITLDTASMAGPSGKYINDTVDISTEIFDSNCQLHYNGYYLNQDSVLVDGGNSSSDSLYGFTTSLDSAEDAGTLDVGYHYPMIIDGDGDGAYAYLEGLQGSYDDNVDSDHDGLLDGYDGKISVNDYLNGIDKDEDGYVDGELDYGYDLKPSAQPTRETDSTLLGWDSDGDGMDDGWEYINDLNPYVAQSETYDTDDDDIPDLLEYQYGLDPQVKENNIAISASDYNDDGNVSIQRSFEIADGITSYTQINTDYDNQGRPWRTRQLINADTGIIDNSNDRISYTEYTASGQVYLTVIKGEGSTDPGTVGVIDTNDLATYTYYDSLGRTDHTVELDVDYTTNFQGKEVHYAYNALGQLDSVKAHINSKSILTEISRNVYDEAGRSYRVFDAKGHYKENKYNSFSQVIESYAYEETAPDTYAKLSETRIEYDNLGRTTKRAVIDYGTGAEGRAINTTDDIVNVYSYYDTTNLGTGASAGKLEKQTIYYNGSSTADTTYYYDALGRQEQIVDNAGNESWVEYSDDGQVKRRKQIENDTIASNDIVLATDYYYNAYGHVIEQRQIPDLSDTSEYISATYTYSNLGRILTQTDAKGIVTTHHYGDFGQKDYMIADSNGIAQKTEYTYDRLGRQKTITGYAEVGTAQTTTYVYDKLNRVESVQYPGHVEGSYREKVNFTYYPSGQIETRTDQNSVATSYTYDDNGNMETKSATKDSIAYAESVTYDGLNRMKKATKTVGGTEVSENDFTYNFFGKPDTAVAEYNGSNITKTVSYDYDNAGNLKELTYPTGKVLDITPGYRGRIASMKINGQTNNLAEYTYIGSQVAQRKYITTSNITTDNTYNNYGQATKRYSYNASTDIAKFDYMYDENGNITDQKFLHRTSDPSNSYGYDDLNRLTFASYPASGLPTSNLNTHWLMDENTGTTTVDTQGNTDNATFYGDTDWTPGKYGSGLQFDGSGDYITVQDTDGTDSMSFANDFTISAWVKIDDSWDGGRFLYRYDTNTLDGFFLSFARNPGNYFWELAIGVNGTIQMIQSDTGVEPQPGIWTHIAARRDSANKVSLFVDGIEQQETYTMAGSFDMAVPLYFGVESDTTTWPYKGIVDDVRMYSRALTNTEIASEVNYEIFEYDKLGNRKNVITPSDTEGESYAINTTTNRYNEIVDGPYDVVCSYDNNGNLTKNTKGAKDYYYQWDPENRLTRVYKKDAGLNEIDVVKYKYDALGRRIEKEDCIAITDKIRRYYYDGWRMLASYNSSNVAQKEYFYGNYLDEVLAISDVSGQTEEMYYLAHDHLYSPVALMDDAGAVVERYEYDAYGKRHVYGADFGASSSSFNNRIAFTGQRIDTLDSGSLEIMYYKNRYYDTGTGRFLSQDPLGYIDGMNLFQYVRSMPICHSDAVGLTSFLTWTEGGRSKPSFIHSYTFITKENQELINVGPDMSSSMRTTIMQSERDWYTLHETVYPNTWDASYNFLPDVRDWYDEKLPISEELMDYYISNIKPSGSHFIGRMDVEKYMSVYTTDLSVLVGNSVSFRKIMRDIASNVRYHFKNRIRNHTGTVVSDLKGHSTGRNLQDATKSIHNFSQWHSAKASYTGKCSWKADIKVHVRDVYDFDINGGFIVNMAFGLNQRRLRLLHLTGHAREFFVDGYVDMIVKWDNTRYFRYEVK
ncbi:MAG: hypothetical protein JEZ07_14630 [Phycisphaerae bacterium]|nr:hypothetical protein [Phycisphaerae bacterium]